jgi:hypothetical protein
MVDQMLAPHAGDGNDGVLDSMRAGQPLDVRQVSLDRNSFALAMLSWIVIDADNGPIRKNPVYKQASNNRTPG